MEHSIQVSSSLKAPEKHCYYTVQKLNCRKNTNEDPWGNGNGWVVGTKTQTVQRNSLVFLLKSNWIHLEDGLAVPFSQLLKREQCHHIMDRLYFFLLRNVTRFLFKESLCCNQNQQNSPSWMYEIGFKIFTALTFYYP